MTGQTGFKGAWLSLWLHRLGATVVGLAQAPLDPQGIFTAARVDEIIEDRRGDVRDPAALRSAVAAARPEIVFHLAAQAFVHAGYHEPLETYDVNVGGTLRLLDALRGESQLSAVVVVTSDKVYEPDAAQMPFEEHDPLGGLDPYSSSKACADIAARSWARSGLGPDGTALAVARAGNVIGGGDRGPRRLVPDIIRAHEAGEQVRLRRPDAVRPWQHVLDALDGYLALARHLSDKTATSMAYNFGPMDHESLTVGRLTEGVLQALGSDTWALDADDHPLETHELRVNSARARAELGWEPLLELPDAVRWTTDWHRAQIAGQDMQPFSLRQVDQYERLRR